MTVHSLDGLESSYRSVLTAARICQLYAFMLLFELLIKLFNVPLSALIWLVSSGFALLLGHEVDNFVLPEVHLRSPLELFFLANVWFLFFIYADFKRSYWVLILCVLGLGHNIGAAYDSLGAFRAGDAFYRYAFLSGMVVSHAYFLMVAVRGQRTIHSLSTAHARVLSEFRPGPRKLAASLLRMINVPGTIRYSRHRIWTGFLQVIAGVANFLNYWVLSMGLVFVSIAPAVFAMVTSAIESKGLALTTLGWSVVIISMFALLIAGLVTFPFLAFWLGRAALRLSRWTMRRSLHEIQGQDRRPPILFLRSFLDDRVAIDRQPFLFEQWLLDSGSRSMTLDYLLLSEGTEYGPTVALGNPDDPAPPYGVARGYFEQSTWKAAVGQLCQRSSAIVIVLGTTEGLDWEIEHIVANQYVEKTLFLLAPSDVGTERGAMLTRRAVAACRGDIGTFPEQSAGRQLVGFWLGSNRRLEPLTTSRLTAYTYLMAIRLFFRTRLD